MQGINPLTGTCTYKTPCGWCTKWDKKCDKKIPKKKKPYEDLFKPCYDCIYNHAETSQCKECNAKNGFKGFVKNVPVSVTNQMCQTEEDHQWECRGISTGGSSYVCKICGKHKTEPVKSSEITTISTYAGNINPLDYEKDPKYEQLLEEARDILFSSLGGYKPLPEQQVYVSTAAIRDTIAYMQSIRPLPTKLKVKSEVYDTLVKAFPPITWSEADDKDIHGIRARFTGIPIVIDDEIENDYEPVYEEED